MTERRKRLIEVAFPLEEVSEYSRRDAYLGSPHPQTLHRWWARRPLPASRAFVYASLVDDPGDDRLREELLKEIADLASWDAVRKPNRVVRAKPEGSGLTGRDLLDRARSRIMECNGGSRPRLLDPFAGGGAIPLEALRLGCEVEASDLNPVAVLILKGTVEYPQRYGRPLADQVELKRKGERQDIAGVDGDVPQYIFDAAKSNQKSFFDGDLVEAYRDNPLATDVRYWGNWMLGLAREKLAKFYPPDPDGGVPIAYLWSRTVPCPNCGAEMPLIRQYWLDRSLSVALRPIVGTRGTVDFEVVNKERIAGDPTEATTAGGDTVCLSCRQVAKAEYRRESGRAGKLGATLTAIAGRTGGKAKYYRADSDSDREAYEEAALELARSERANVNELPLVPDEPIDQSTLGLRVDEYGLTVWRDLFNARQLLTLVTLSEAVRDVLVSSRAAGLDEAYSQAIATYAAFIVDRAAGENSTLTRWNPTGAKAQGVMALQAFSMTSDYAELNPWGGSVGDVRTALSMIADAVEELSRVGDRSAIVERRDAREVTSRNLSSIVTDPPYYNSVDYAGLSDYFYVWLRRSVAEAHPGLLELPLTPKKQQAIMASERKGDLEARDRYVSIMSEAFRSSAAALSPGSLMGIVFAHTDPDAWATLIEGLLATGLIPDASWPLDTEIGTKFSASTQARLKTSVWMACRPRLENAAPAFLDDVLREMRPVIRERLLYFWSKGIRGADFFISAIGPALSVFGRHMKVMYLDGKNVSVRDFLDLVRRESTEVALEQVLGGAVLGQLDSLTRQYVTWIWSYSRAPLDAGEAIALCLATGADYGEVVREGSIAAEAKEKSKKMVKLRSIKERGEKEDELGISNGARPIPLIDQLQRAAHLWFLNRTDQLATYRESLGETRWTALRTLGQAVAECLPEGDEDRRLIHGLLGSNVMATTPRDNRTGAQWREQPGKVKLPGFEKHDDSE